ncbi:MAG: hypothetical protein AAF604_21815 [Acidobacteriota bacterium]
MLIERKSHPVSASLSNRGGSIRLDADNPAVGYWDWIGVYQGSYPSDPSSNLVTWQWVSRLPDTLGTPWRSNLLVAYVGWDYRAGRYVYVARDSAQRTSSSRPDIRATDSFEVTVTLDRDPANRIILGGTTDSAVGYWDWVGLYAGQVPDDSSGVISHWPTDHSDSRYVTSGLPQAIGQQWQPGFLATYVAWDYRRSSYVNLAETTLITI